MASATTVTGGWQAPAAPLPQGAARARTALLLAALLAAGQPAAAQDDEAIVIVQGYDKLGDAKYEFAPARSGAIVCYAYDKDGMALGHQRGYVEAGSIRFYGIPFASVGEVTCERLD